ncbi:hypothetical protein [Noviherbaspirillum sp. ST9]|uniref:hypothetical protein n=1 Tax=Noviherbaspirillum sp. ST9 TaxID=3401606 RepID=UPI003B5872F9
MAHQQTKVDPIREKYFGPLETAEKWSDGLFYVTAILSVAALLVEESTYPRINAGIQVIFVIAVIASFALGQAISLYLAPRAQDRRTQDFFSAAYQVPLSHEQTTAYYNNDQADPLKKVGAQLLENSLFSKEIARAMVMTSRWQTAIYAVVWIVALLNRNASLALAATVAQVLFSEQILSRWIRLEWLKIRFEKTYSDLYRLFQAKPKADKFNAMALDSFTTYETAKAIGGITLSSTIFERLNPQLSLEWEQIKRTLGI